MPTPEELAALLALPASAREALARCEGPGWWPGSVPYRQFKARGPDMLVPALWTLTDEYDERSEGHWLPCDTAAILGVVAEREGWSLPLLFVRLREHWKPGEPMRLAALRLLAAVSLVCAPRA